MMGRIDRLKDAIGRYKRRWCRDFGAARQCYLSLG